MGIILHSSLNLKNTTIQYAQNIISLFPHRYHRYYHNNLEGIWKCILLNIQSNPIKLQLVDLTYDRPRGKNVSFESPILFISLQELGRDVAMEYKLKWKTSVIFCVLIFLLFSLFSFGMGLWSILYLSAEKKSTVLLVISMVLLIGDIVWIYRMRKHDKLILRVFSELLHNNFHV